MSSVLSMFSSTLVSVEDEERIGEEIVNRSTEEDVLSVGSDEREEGDSGSDSGASDDESGYESESDLDFTEFVDLSLKDGSEKYVVSIDDVPQFYVNTREEAVKRMWDTARRIRARWSSQVSYIAELSEYGSQDTSELHILGRARIFLVQYDRLLFRLTVNAVKELVEEEPQDLKED